MPKTQPQTQPAADESPLLFHVERLQERLDDVATQVGQQERLAMLGTMAASIAHEINNILTPVKAYAELALSSPGDTGLVIKALERAAHGVDRATRISEMILACSRARPPTALADVADAARRAEAGLPPVAGGVFHVEHRVDTGVVVAIDPVALEQIFVNLLLNARAAMPTGGTVTISAHAAQTGVEVRVADTGRGIPPDSIKHVFASFVTFSEAGTKRERTGLGLPICRRLVVEAGGSIDLQSIVGKGTTVIMRLPAPAKAPQLATA